MLTTGGSLAIISLLVAISCDLASVSGVVTMPVFTQATSTPALETTDRVHNLRLFYNKPFGVNVTWDYSSPDEALLSQKEVLFTVEYYRLFIGVCCGPVSVANCTLTRRRWCQVDGLTSTDGYYIVVRSEQGAYESNATSGFIVNGNNAPAGCPLVASVSPWLDCSVNVNFQLSLGYGGLIAAGRVSVTVEYSSVVMGAPIRQVLSTKLRFAPFDKYTINLGNTSCNSTFHVTFEASTSISNVVRTTGKCFRQTVTTTPYKAPVSAKLSSVAGSMNTTSMAVSWTLAIPVVGSKDTSGFIICHSPVSETLASFAAQHTQHHSLQQTSSPGTSQHSKCSRLRGIAHSMATLSSLLPGIVYAVNVTAYNRYGMGASSNTVLVATSDAAPQWRAANITCTQLSDSTANVTWNAPTWNTQPTNRQLLQLTWESSSSHVGSPSSQDIHHHSSVQLSWRSMFTVIAGIVPGVEYGMILTAQTETDNASVSHLCILENHTATTTVTNFVQVTSSQALVANPSTMGGHTKGSVSSSTTRSSSTSSVTPSVQPTATGAGAGENLQTAWIVAILSGCGLALAILTAMCVWFFYKERWKRSSLLEQRRHIHADPPTAHQAEGLEPEHVYPDERATIVENYYTVLPRQLATSASDSSSSSENSHNAGGSTGRDSGSAGVAQHQGAVRVLSSSLSPIHDHSSMTTQSTVV